MTEIIQITENKDKVLQEKLTHNFYENRFDITYDGEYDLYLVNGIAVPVHIYRQRKPYKMTRCVAGMTLTEFDDKTANDFYKFLFKKYPVKKIEVFCSKSPAGRLGKYCKSIFHRKKCLKPYLYIELPKTKEEFDKRLAKQVRYNTKWYPKKIRENFGDYNIQCYDTNNPNNKDIIDKALTKFFEWKKKTHHKDYDISPERYIEKFYITQVYVLSLNNTNEIMSVGFINDAGVGVYFNNFSYNQDEKYRKYSFGMVLFYHIICDLINKGRKAFYLGRGGGANFVYKERYGATKVEPAYTGDIYRRFRLLKGLTYFIKHRKDK